MRQAQEIAERIVKALKDTLDCQVTPCGQRIVERVLREELPKIERDGQYNRELRLAERQAEERRTWERNRTKG